jgi:putative oxidoreductase
LLQAQEMRDLRALQSAWGLLFLRLSAAAMLFAGHGLDKLQNLTERALHFPDPLGIGGAPSIMLAIFAEAVCTVLVMVGLLTRWAAVPIITTMLIAAVWVHKEDPWSAKEFALLYAIPFVTVLLMGPGRFSLDAWRTRRAQARRRRL